MSTPISASVIKRKVHVVGGADSYANWMEAQLVDHLEDADLVVFSGGSDVSSYLYHEKPHRTTSSDPARDRFEVTQFEKARALGKHMWGTCRGHQFLSVMNGSKLVQDQGNPFYKHPIKTYDGQRIVMTSTHHQASAPWNLPRDQFKVLAWTKGISSYHDGAEWGRDIVIGTAPDDIEIEGLYFKETKCASLQGHPESLFEDAMDGDPHAGHAIEWCRATLDAHLANTL